MSILLKIAVCDGHPSEVGQKRVLHLHAAVDLMGEASNHDFVNAILATLCYAVETFKNQPEIAEPFGELLNIATSQFLSAPALIEFATFADLTTERSIN